MTEKEFELQQKIIRTLRKRFADEHIDLEPGDSELALCSTMNIVAGELALPLRFEIVWSCEECWIFSRIKWFWDVYLGNFTCLSADWVADTVWNMIQERNRLQYIADRWNNPDLIDPYLIEW